MNRRTLLDHGTQMRQCILTVYRHYPADDAAKIVRQMVFEIGQAFGDIHSRPDAAAMMYSAADAITCKLPVEDFRLQLTPPPQEVQTVPAVLPFKQLSWIGKLRGGAGRVMRFALSWQFLSGYWVGWAVGRLS